MTKNEQIDRLHNMFEMRFNGATLAEIGKRFGITKCRAYVLIQKAIFEFGMEGRVDYVLGVRVSYIETRW